MPTANAPHALDLNRLRLALLGAMGLPLWTACTGGSTPKETGGGFYGDDGGSGDGSGDGSSDGSGDGTTDGGDGGGTAGCEGAESIAAADGAATGYERCPDGAINRVEPVAAPGGGFGPSCVGDETFRDCTTDAECTSGDYGHCISGTSFELGETTCTCAYGCTTDADCGADSACIPMGIVETGVSWSTCAPAACLSNDDCAPSEECGLSSYYDGCFWVVQLSCRSEADGCRTDADCDSTAPDCAVDYATAGRFECLSAGCAIGRPLHDQHEAVVVAPAVARRDWGAPIAFTLPENSVQRDRLGAHWLNVAQMEHASVASFSRFSLQLLQLGAPPELLRGAHTAAQDEIHHAEAAFGVASALLGRAVGPGPLHLGAVDLHADRARAIADLTIEACLGETIGAAEARAAAEACTEPALRALLLQIAQEEESHAALGWRSLGWMLQGAGPELHSVVEAALERGVAEVMGGATADDAEDDARWGRLGAVEQRRLRARVIDAVVRPCLTALLGSLTA
jgi:hypothetical protein